VTAHGDDISVNILPLLGAKTLYRVCYVCGMSVVCGACVCLCVCVCCVHVCVVHVLCLYVCALCVCVHCVSVCVVLCGCVLCVVCWRQEGEEHERDPPPPMQLPLTMLENSAVLGQRDSHGDLLSNCGTQCQVCVPSGGNDLYEACPMTVGKRSSHGPHGVLGPLGSIFLAILCAGF
jgi:hypothetical protein